MGKRIAGELAALIGIEDLGLAVAGQGIFECGHAEISIHGVGYRRSRYPELNGKHATLVAIQFGIPGLNNPSEATTIMTQGATPII